MNLFLLGKFSKLELSGIFGFLVAISSIFFGWILFPFLVGLNIDKVSSYCFFLCKSGLMFSFYLNSYKIANSYC